MAVVLETAVTATLGSKRRRNATVKGRWPADEAVVVVKLTGYEDAVTYLRQMGIIHHKSGSSGIFEPLV